DGAGDGTRLMEHDIHLQQARDEADPVAAKADFVLPTGEHVLRALESRRSVATGLLTTPGPNEEELHRILTIATRVPDHGKLEPWRLLMFEGEARLAA